MIITKTFVDRPGFNYHDAVRYCYKAIDWLANNLGPSIYKGETSHGGKYVTRRSNSKRWDLIQSEYMEIMPHDTRMSTSHDFYKGPGWQVFISEFEREVPSNSIVSGTIHIEDDTLAVQLKLSVL
jgi:hypothetical protein